MSTRALFFAVLFVLVFWPTVVVVLTGSVV